jgi:AcrR family transcriptional regulator
VAGKGSVVGESTSHLRNRPRQARSVARVEVLLDAAAHVFEEVGYDTATTNQVAARAGVPVGTLYRWFPDKRALAEGLTDRYLERLVALSGDLLTQIEPEEHIGDFLRQVMARLVEDTGKQRALSALLVSAMVPGGHSPAGERMRSGMAGHIQTIIELRVPGVPDDVRDRTADVCVTLAHMVVAAAAATDHPECDLMTAEYVDVMIAYLEAKFPSADNPVWSDTLPAVKPVFPAPDRATRLAALTDDA